jgi:hypothetical protein
MKNILSTAITILLFATVVNAQNGSIFGTVFKLDDDLPLEGVTVKLFSGNTLLDELYTDNNGEYSFADLTLGETYRVECIYETANPLDGVSTLDLVLISKHILGIDPLPTPFHMVSADVNNSGNVSVLDIVKLRKVILGIDPPFEYPWIFLPISYDFGFGTTDLSAIQLLNQTINIDIYAIKKGDVD